jgi:hypothetical protein
VAAQRLRWAAAAWLVTLALGGCGSSAPPASTGGSGVPAALVREARPIGRGPRFHPPASGPVLGDCRRPLGGRVGVHVELFAANRVVLIAAGIGARPPLHHGAGRITAARCFGELVTVDPTGVVLIAPGGRLTLGDLFRSWGQPLSERRMASFGGPVRVYVDGRSMAADPVGVRLVPHSEIVLEVGPYVPPHTAYRFPSGA